MRTRPYVFEIIRCDRVLDGDTFDLTVDVGFRLFTTIRVRLLGFDTPERSKGSEYEREKAREATEATTAWFGTMSLGGRWWVRTEKDPDNFGRWLGDVWVEDHASVQSLGGMLEARGLATSWPTRWRDVHDRFVCCGIEYGSADELLGHRKANHLDEVMKDAGL